MEETMTKTHEMTIDEAIEQEHETMVTQILEQNPTLSRCVASVRAVTTMLQIERERFFMEGKVLL